MWTLLITWASRLGALKTLWGIVSGLFAKRSAPISVDASARDAAQVERNASTTEQEDLDHATEQTDRSVAALAGDRSVLDDTRTIQAAIDAANGPVRRG